MYIKGQIEANRYLILQSPSVLEKHNLTYICQYTAISTKVVLPKV